MIMEDDDMIMTAAATAAAAVVVINKRRRRQLSQSPLELGWYSGHARLGPEFYMSQSYDFSCILLSARQG